MYNTHFERGGYIMNKTINEVYQDYINFLKLKNKETTVLFIQRKFKNYIIPYFGNNKINEINEQIYIDFRLKINELNYSESFFKQIDSILKNFFEYLNAMYNVENIPKKLNKIIVNKKNSLSNKERQIWNKKEFKKFIKKVDDKIYHALFNVLFFTGIRKGEALALKISDFKNGYLHINFTITKELFNNKRLITTPKSKKSIRKIKLDIFTQYELNQLIKYYSKKYSNFNENFFLFGANSPLSFSTLERKKNYYCKKAGVKQIRIHDFRHSHATMLYNKKIKVKLIQERLGHADISTTLNTYIHNNQKEEKRLIKMINLIRL